MTQSSRVGGNVLVWNRELVFGKEEKRATCRDCLLTQDAKQFVTIHSDGEVVLWDLDTLTEIQAFKHQLRGPTLSAIDEPNKRILVQNDIRLSTETNVAVIFNLATGRVENRGNRRRSKIKFSATPEDHYFTSRTKRWHLRKSGELVRLKKSAIAVNDIAQRTTLRWAVRAGRIKGYNVQSEQLVLRLIHFRETNDWLAFTPDGRYDGTEDARQLVSYRVLSEPMPELAPDDKAAEKILQQKESVRKAHYSPGLISRQK